MSSRTVIKALLGPTNTGKTHRAIERMLESSSGIIGLPLRLLAREVYDKVSARLGESAVALITGEEKRIGGRARYFVCTTEAMPEDREVEFVAVDEIQLAAHETRGHVFTDRLLRARGTRETWFLGSLSMQELLLELVPTVQIETHPRLSSLRYAGATSLGKVPARSAVVAFSMPAVYELGERLGSMKGGAALVLGALSPRTRNAQVAMFQAGEVDYLVATDAIGMGLNLDVRHVAFGATRKFDGRSERGLTSPEMAQIAGRAGRYLSDGTFGSLASVYMDPEDVLAIEQHRFPRVKRVRWRHSELSFDSVDDLLASLHEKSPRAALVRVKDAEDESSLRSLLAVPEVTRRISGPESVRLLWDVCTIPDFRKLLWEQHVEMQRDVFVTLVDKGGLDETFMQERAAECRDPEGDIDTLLFRISAVRTLSYVAHQRDMVVRAKAWQRETREIEDALSDALHERLVARFVQKPGRTRVVFARPRSRGPVSREQEAHRVSSGHPFAKLAGLTAAGRPQSSACESLEDAWVSELVQADHGAFVLEPSGHIREAARSGRELGRLVPGTSITKPDVKILGHLSLGGGARARLLRRLLAFTRDVVAELLEGCYSVPLPDTLARRALVSALEQGLGTCAVRPEFSTLDLSRSGLVLNRDCVYDPSLLSEPAHSLRVALAATHFGLPPSFSPEVFARSGRAAPHVPVSAYLAVGFVVREGRVVRCDGGTAASDGARHAQGRTAASDEPPLES